MDTDGYPEDHELEKIRLWNENYTGLMDYVHDLWRWPDFGWSHTVDKDGVEFYRLATGGWSGNEDLIAALRSNALFWMMCWKASVRGGVYLFTLPQPASPAPETGDGRE